MVSDTNIVQEIFGLKNLATRRVRQLFSTFGKAFTITHDRDKCEELFHIYSDPALTDNDNCYILIPKEETLGAGSHSGINPSTAQWEDINIFFNLLSTIDLSLAIPFIEVRWFDSYHKNEATDITGPPEPLMITKGVDNDIYDPGAEAIDPDLYFLPQTYYDEAKNKFRPFLAVKSFDVDVTNPADADIFAQYSATLVLKLFDITRLNDVRKFIYPGQSYASTLLIEYGWQHPHGDITFASRFINTLRSAMYWQVNMYDVTIKQDNTADITLQLNTITPFKLARASLISDKELTTIRTVNMNTQAEIIKKRKADEQKREKAERSRARKEKRKYVKHISQCDTNRRSIEKVGQSDISYPLDKSGKSDTRNKLKKALGEQLENFFRRVFLIQPAKNQKKDTIRSNESHAINRFKKFVEDEISEIAHDDSNKSLNILNFKLAESDNVKNDSYTYLALLLMRLYGSSVAAAESTSESHIETQIIFLNFNKKAAKMAEKNIGSFLIYFKRKPEKMEKPTGFLDFIQKTILETRNYNPRLDLVFSYIKNLLNNPHDKNYSFKLNKLEPEITTLEDNRIAHKYKRQSKKYTQKDFEFIVPEIVFLQMELQANAQSKTGIKIVRRIFVMDLAEPLPKDETQKVMDKIDKKCSATPEDLHEAIGIFRRELPIISIGTERNMIKELAVKTMSDASFQSVFLTQTNVTENASNTADNPSFPGEFLPVMVELQTLGFPNLQFGSQVYLDLHTNSSVDDVYRIIGIKHQFQPGSITTSAQLYPGTGWMRYKSAKSDIDKLEESENNDK